MVGNSALAGAGMPLSVRRPGVTALGRRRCITGPSRSGPCLLAPHVRHRGRAARGRRTYARTRVKIQTWFLNSVLVAESRRTVVCRSRPHRAWRGPSSRRSAPLPRLPRTPRACHCVRIGAGVCYSPQRKCDVDEVFPRSPPRFPVEDQIRPARRDLCRWVNVACATSPGVLPAGRNGQVDLKQAVRATRKRAGGEELSIRVIGASNWCLWRGRVAEVARKPALERIMKEWPKVR